MKKSTSREHYEKYRSMAERLGVNFDQDSPRLFGVTLEQLRARFEADPYLNNIPLHRFDSYAISLMICNRGKGLSLSDGVCLAKHCLIYQVLGVEPEFETT